MELTFSQYQKDCLKTANYPNIGDNLVYPVLGLCGESGELFEKITTYLNESKFKIQNTDEIVKEIGDILWYLFVVLYELGVTENKIKQWFDYETFDSFENNVLILYANSITEISEYTFITNVMFSSLKVAELTKKYIRDDNYKISDERKEKIIHNLKMLLYFLTRMCIHSKFDLHISSIAKDNTKKLYDRYNRGVIRGDGDYR